MTPIDKIKRDAVKSAKQFESIVVFECMMGVAVVTKSSMLPGPDRKMTKVFPCSIGLVKAEEVVEPLIHVGALLGTHGQRIYRGPPDDWIHGHKPMFDVYADMMAMAAMSARQWNQPRDEDGATVRNDVIVNQFMDLELESIWRLAAVQESKRNGGHWVDYVHAVQTLSLITVLFADMWRLATHPSVHYSKKDPSVNTILMDVASVGGAASMSALMMTTPSEFGELVERAENVMRTEIKSLFKRVYA